MLYSIIALLNSLNIIVTNSQVKSSIKVKAS